VVSGDPVGPPEEAGAAIGAFLSHARSRGWRVVVLGASDRFLPVYRQHGLHPLYHGDSAQRIQRRALLRLKDALALQLDNLLRFNRQFSPGWQPRYVIVEHRADLPRVALAAMAAEGYLPYAGLIRGSGWSPPAEPPPPGKPPAGQSAEREPSGGRR
jgi:lysylphosphatidylglycerol synthetase-like protein (DUF2156 family)